MSDALDNDTSFWENLKTRTANVKKTASRQKPDDNPYLNSAELAIAALGQTAGYAGDVAGEFVPEALQQVGEYLGEAVMSTSPAQNASRFLTDVSEDYPRTSDFIGNVLNIAGATGAGTVAKRAIPTGTMSSVGSLINKTAQNVPTRIKDFYTNPVKGAINFGTEYTKAVLPAIKESINPQAVAKRRVLGISDSKIDDWMSDVGQDAEKTAISINRQVDAPEDTLLEKGVVGLNYLDSRIPREDVATLSSAVGQGFRTSGKIPESIVERATKHLTDGPHIKKQNYRYDYQIKDPSVDKNIGYVESIGVSGAGAPVVRALHGKATDTYLTSVNKLNKIGGDKAVSKLQGKDMVEFMQVSSTLNGDAYQLMKKLGVNGQPSQMLDTLLLARAKSAKGLKLYKGEQKSLDSFNKLLNTRAIKMARVSDEAGNPVGSRNLVDIKEPEGYLVTQQSFNSRQKELGGMNAFVVVDPNKEKMYTMLSDGHDILGKDPVGGHGLITASPLIESSIKTGAKYNNKQIKTNRTPRKINRAIKETEAVTGIKKTANETNEAYTKRAFRNSRPAVTQADRDRAASARNKLVGTGLLTTSAVAYAASDDE